MSKNNPSTDEILNAIKNMMLEKPVQQSQELPKDVIELTNPVDLNSSQENEKIDILELSNPINEKINTSRSEEQPDMQKNIEDIIEDSQIRKAVRETINSLPSSKLDEIINDELTKIIQEKLNSSKIIISTENKKD